ncbi:MAG: hypothetical protein H0W30_04220 [Gemmatimonadaceae bacterium]|nr:hypothetical protein [Gemmatimonadaceae bacterium]MDQ3516806.1 hypothetical protein [Gemmatimonadota bacterium]
MSLAISVHAAVLAACAGEAKSPAGAAVMRDSAGIQIVENVSPKWTEAERWTVADTPSVEIGGAEGDTSSQLFQAYKAVRLSDGRIVVANAGTHQLRFYDREGGYLFSSGRKGGGPGEFESLYFLAKLGGDSLLTFDFNGSRVSIFGPDGKFVRSFALKNDGGQILFSLAGMLSDGSLLVYGQRPFGPGRRDGLHRDSVLFLITTSDGSVRDTVGRFPGSESMVIAEGQSMSVTSRAFGRTTEVTVHADRVYLGGGDSYEIGVYTPGGVLRQLIRKQHKALDVTPEDIKAYEKKRLEEASDENWKRLNRRFLEKMDYPKTMPPLSRILVDASGNVWVREYGRSTDEQPRWTVFDPEGRMLGTLKTPRKVVFLEVGADFMLGRWSDDDDIEHIGVFPLVKPVSK